MVSRCNLSLDTTADQKLQIEIRKNIAEHNICRKKIHIAQKKVIDYNK